MTALPKGPPANFPVSGLPFEFCLFLTANRYPLTALTYAYSSTWM
jgi:hypothetical protein